jgi:ankyrin repeat protein
VRDVRSFARIWLLLAAGSVVGPVAIGQEPFPEVQDFNSVRFALERGRCFGSCPVYRVEILGDGTVNYTGTLFVAVTGQHTHHIPQEAVKTLLNQFRQADFFNFDPEYRAWISDLPTQTISLSIDGRKMTVVNYGGPRELSELERAIDRTARVAIWVRGNAETVPALIREGYDFKDEEGGKLAIRVAAQGDSAVLKALIDAGAPLDVEDEQHRTALSVAALRANHESIVLLIKAGASARDPRAKAAALVNAAGVGDLETVRMMLDYGADANLQRPFTALIAAASSGSAEIVEEILKHHPDVDSRDMQGRTAIRVVGEAGLTSGQQNLARVTELLIAAGANVNAADTFGNTALHGAADERSAKALIAAGAKVNAQNRAGETPLMTTVDDGVARALLSAGADLTIKNRDGLTALDIARRNALTEKAAMIETAVRAPKQ